MVVSSAPSVLRVGAAVLLAFVLFSALPSAHPAKAATLTVANLNDSGDGSLRNAIDTALPGDAITFGVNGTITLTSGELSINKDLTINGPGAASLAVSGDHASRVFNVLGGTVSMSSMTIRDGVTGQGGGIWVSDGSSVSLADVVVSGNQTNGDGAGIFNAGNLTVSNSTVSGNAIVNISDAGGGILNATTGTLQVTASTISGNTATGQGGAIENAGTAALTNSTLSGNIASNDSFGGGAILNGGILTLLNDTISGNTTPSVGGGIYACCSGTLSLKNTIVAGNTAAGSDPDCAGAITSQGHNLIQDTSGCTVGGDSASNITGQDPKLGPLADNGGPTQTQALLSGSPAIDSGSPDCPPPETDQRGVSRPQGTACDIGAFESQPGSAIWGDGDCSGAVAPRDGQADLNHFLNQTEVSQTPPCPGIGASVTINGLPYTWGDWDCSGAVAPRDGQADLNHFLNQGELSQTPPCPTIGETVQVVG